MHSVRPVFATDPRRFGRAIQPIAPALQVPAPSRISDDLKLFAATFAAGFIFVSVFLA